VVDEQLFGDRVVQALYSSILENASMLTRLASNNWVSNALAILNYDTLLGSQALGMIEFLRATGTDLSECVEPPETLNNARKVFERQLRYWECRPLPPDRATAVCPADARVIVGSLRETSTIFIKEKLFRVAELLSVDRPEWFHAFVDADFAVFRLTPEKYHYVHVPASGRVEDFYEIRGRYHSCNPGATVSLIRPYAKNRRMVTILQTDVPLGERLGLVAIVEVVALMVGQITQRYSSERYRDPQAIQPGMFLKRGQPKSLFQPGSSTVILLFQKDRIRFAEDLLVNRFRLDASSRFSLGFNQPVVETDVAVRSLLGTAVRKGGTV
jgi:phosphatidylserine decarboxylase